MNPFNKPQIELIKSFGDKNVLESYKGVDIQEYYKKTYNTEPPVEAYAEEVEFQEMNTGKAREKNLLKKLKNPAVRLLIPQPRFLFRQNSIIQRGLQCKLIRH